MFFALLSLIGLYLLLRLWARWRRVKSYWSHKNVPHTLPHFIMGSLTFLQRENPAIYMKNVYKDSKSPYYGMWLFWRPALIINSPDIARRVLVKDSDNFRNRFLSSGKSDPLGALNLVAVKDPLWSSIRRRLTFVFTAAKLRGLQHLTSKKCDDLVIRINREVLENGRINNLRLLFTDFTTDVIGEAAFGIESEATLTGDSTMRKITRELMEFNLIRGLSWSSIFFLPELVDWFGLKFFPKKTTDYLQIIVNKIIEQRSNFFMEKEPKDLLDALIKIKEEAFLAGEKITDEVVLAQALIFLVGGFDTSGSAITWTTLELAHKQQFQERLYNELSDAKQKHAGKLLDPTTLAGLPYLNAVIKEALRKFPPMGWLDRIAGKDYVIDDKLTIPGGTPVYVNAIGMHWDPEFFPEPEKFDPDRFLPENEVNIKPYTYLPFGDGPRNCIGIRFGQQTVRYAIATIFSNFQVLPLPDTPKADDLEIEKKGMFLMPGETISVKLVPRKVDSFKNV